MEFENAAERLEGLQRDLIAFSENRLPNLQRLSAELEASVEDLRKFLDKKAKNEDSRKILNPSANPTSDILNIEGAEYRVTEDFRQAALQVADELDLDEIEAAKLCVEAEADNDGNPDPQLPYKALLRYHNYRYTKLDCVRLLFMQATHGDADYEISEWFLENVRRVIRGSEGNPDGASSYWKKCLDGLSEVEAYQKKIGEHKEAAIMTGILFEGDFAEALIAQRMLLEKQHETLGCILSYLIQGGHVGPSDFRLLLNKAASLETDTAILTIIHYFPVLISGSAYFGANDSTTAQAAKDLHILFAEGPAQLQWKSTSLHAAATVWWLAEYNSRFADPLNTGTLRVADRQKEEEDRTQLFLKSIQNKALHLMLLACQYLKPEVWHDPAKVGLVRFLLEEYSSNDTADASVTPMFADLVMGELQVFSDAIVANMPDVLRRLKTEEDDRRRTYFSLPNEGVQQVDLHLERFMVIMAYAYQDDAEAAQDFWADRESNLYGFLRWASQRLPTPRVAAFCELLTSIAGSEKSGNQAHRFLLEDTTTTSGKLRRSYSVCWVQIFSELEVFASSTRNRPAAPPQPAGSDDKPLDVGLVEPETYIMLEAYLRLATHICHVSSEARNWILREQTFHLGEVLFHLASSGQQSRVHASCFDLLSALLTDKIPEVNDGIWVLLDNWIAGGGSAGSVAPRPSITTSRTLAPERQYLQSFANDFETATGLVNLLGALITPPLNLKETISDSLPFPENLGSPHRHGGIDSYVDFVLGTALRSTLTAASTGVDRVQADVLRCACLHFICVSLSTFNEDLVAFANTTTISVDRAMRTSSLAAYARLHPFARVMDWMFNSNTIAALVSCLFQELEEVDNLDPGTPRVQATLRAVTTINLVMKMQATYFDIVKPLNKVGSSDRLEVGDSAYASFDEVILSHLDVVVKIATFISSAYTDLSLESLDLLQKICASKKLGEKPHYGSRERGLLGSRLIGKLAGRGDALSSSLRQFFQIYDWDLENGERSMKLIKAKSIVDVLNSSLDTTGGQPSLAHCLLGFDCHNQGAVISAGALFSQGQSLFHSIAAFGATSPYAIDNSNVSWLLSVKRGCFEIILKLSTSQVTSTIVCPELRALELLSAACQNQLPALANPLWDQRPLQDRELLLEDSAFAMRDFLYVRKSFFEYAALDLRSTHEQHAYSVQEEIVSALLGVIRFPNGEQGQTASLFDLFDFLDLETTVPSDASCRYLKDLDLSACLRDDRDTVTAFDVDMVEQLVALRKRELITNGVIKDAFEEQQLDDEVRAIQASVISQNNWRAIQSARLGTLEAWTELLSLMITAGGLGKDQLATVASQGLQVTLIRFERAISDDLDAAPLLAKLILSLVTASTAIDHGEKASTSTFERLLSTFRVCLKAITDSDTDLALRDVCYRTAGHVFSIMPLTVVNGKTQPSSNAKQLLQIIQTAGERLLTVITEDAFSGRGITRVSSLLFLDSLVTLCQLTKTLPAMLRALMRLNFLPVLTDQTIGSVASSFGRNEEELVTAVAYFHTALALLLRICQDAEGSQVVQTSGFFSAVADSGLFSTDPDIGLDIDNPSALREFYRLLSSVLRVITAMVVVNGPHNTSTMQAAKNFLRVNRFSMQAVFKRTSAVQKTAGPPEQEATEVAEEFGKLLLVTDFLEEDEPALVRNVTTNGFT